MGGFSSSCKIQNTRIIVINSLEFGNKLFVKRVFVVHLILSLEILGVKNGKTASAARDNVYVEMYRTEPQREAGISGSR